MRLLVAALCLGAIVLPLAVAPSVNDAAPAAYDLIIRNGRVIDGTGRPVFNADIAIKDDRIARIGNLRGAQISIAGSILQSIGAGWTSISNASISKARASTSAPLSARPRYANS